MSSESKATDVRYICVQLGDTSVMVTAVSRGRSGPAPSFLPLTVIVLCIWKMKNYAVPITAE